MVHWLMKSFTVNLVLQITLLTLFVIKPTIALMVKDGIDTSNTNINQEFINRNKEYINSDDYNYDYDDNFNKTCYLPNQIDNGNCVVISKCLPYLKVRNYSNLTPWNVNFLKQIQCKSVINYKNFNNDIKEPTVCCPLNGRDYQLPQVKFSKKGRILVGDNKMKIKKFKRRIQKIHNSTTFLLDNNECGKQITNRIYGGEIAELDEYPWLALIFYNSNEFGCSGALINHRYVLTAAHCVIGPIVREKKGLKHVRLGEFNVKTQPDCIEEINYVNCADAAVDIGVQKIHVHPDYEERSLNKLNDIALIKLRRHVTFTHFIMPICLPKKDDTENPLIPGKFFSVSGWGKTDLFNKFFLNIRSPIKLKLRVPFVSRDNCSEILSPYGAILGPKQICAGGEFAKDTCAGDSGGPLMHFDSKLSRWVTYGIVSYGFTQCGLAGHPAVYTNVIEYIEWITKTILENN